MIDSLSKGRVFTSMDIKAGFHNIPLTQKARAATVFITQDGVYCWNVMPFGLKGAPAHFQRALQLTIQTPDDLSVVVYIDDSVIMGQTWRETWTKILEAIKKLSKAGFMLNIAKCHFLSDKISIVGMEVVGGEYNAKPSKIQALFTSKIPSSIREL